MKIFRIVMSVIFILTSVVFVFSFVADKINTDASAPKITIDSEVIEVSIKDGEDELLKGVTAFDNKDKDITDKIIVESVSSFTEPGTCRVTYAVCDSDNNVASVTRKLRYIDYTSPKFSMKDDLCFSLYERMNISDIIEADDCILGDISDDIVLTSVDYTSSVAGVFKLEATITNDKGDTATLELPLVVEDSSVSAPKIVLKEYLVYAKKGDKLNFKKYIDSVNASNGDDVSDTVYYETDMNTQVPGTYSVHYYATDSNGVRGHAILTVVVEG